MNRSDLIIQLSERSRQLTQRDAELAVNAILTAMADALARGGRIEIRDFGSFSVKNQAPKLGRNPRSGESVSIPGKRAVHFKPGKGLREAVDLEASRIRL
jgi:integration host factor subunit beta